MAKAQEKSPPKYFFLPFFYLTLNMQFDELRRRVRKGEGQDRKSVV